MRYSFFDLLEEAHSQGRNCKHLWEEKQSFENFLSQYNLIKEYKNFNNKKMHPELAKGLKGKGYTIREIAKILGYKHPGSITNLLKQ